MKVIKDWRKATEQVAMAFTKKYFKSERYGKDTFWVGAMNKINFKNYVKWGIGLVEGIDLNPSNLPSE